MSHLLLLLDRVERALIALLAGVALLLACVAMLGRYVLPDLALDWTFDATIFIVIWVTFLAGARTAGRGEHVRVDTLLRLLPAPWRRWLVVLAGVLGIAVALFLFWSGWTVVAESIRWDERTTSSLRMPLWIYYLCMPVGAVLLAFHLVIRTIGVLTGAVEDDLAPLAHGDG